MIKITITYNIKTGVYDVYDDKNKALQLNASNEDLEEYENNRLFDVTFKRI